MQCHHWFPHKMMSKKKMQKLHTNDASLATQSWVVLLTDWLCHKGNLLQPMRSTTQLWVMTHHQDQISVLISQMQGKPVWHHKMSAVFSS